MTYQDRIKGLREDADLTQAEMAKILNIAQTTYSQYERGSRGIPIEILLKISEYYKISTDWILKG